MRTGLAGLFNSRFVFAVINNWYTQRTAGVRGSSIKPKKLSERLSPLIGIGGTAAGELLQKSRQERKNTKTETPLLKNVVNTKGTKTYFMANERGAGKKKNRERVVVVFF